MDGRAWSIARGGFLPIATGIAGRVRPFRSDTCARISWRPVALRWRSMNAPGRFVCCGPARRRTMSASCVRIESTRDDPMASPNQTAECAEDRSAHRAMSLPRRIVEASAQAWLFFRNRFRMGCDAPIAAASRRPVRRPAKCDFRRACAVGDLLVCFRCPSPAAARIRVACRLPACAGPAQCRVSRKESPFAAEGARTPTTRGACVPRMDDSTYKEFAS